MNLEGERSDAQKSLADHVFNEINWESGESRVKEVGGLIVISF